MTYPSARTVTDWPDAAGRLGSVASSGERQQITGQSLKAGTVNRLTLTWSYGSTGNNGNVQTHTILPGTSGISYNQSFSYNAYNRLETASEPGGWSQTYRYHRSGIRALLSTSTIPNGNDTPQTPDQTVPFAATNNRWNGQNHDQNGNLTSQTTGLARGLTDDAEKHITQSVTNLGTALYAYDGDGRRVRRTLRGINTIWVYDAAGQLAAEYSTGVTEVECRPCHVTTDALGSTRLLTKADQGVVRRKDYFPFGEEIGSAHNNRGSQYGSGAPIPPVANKPPVLFTGKERDAETGLDYFGARYFSGAQGRFTSPDPIHIMPQKLFDPQQWNMYGYARNNPLRFVDPTGMYVDDCATGDKACTKRIDKFEKARQKDLKSKNEAVRDAASQYGDRGKANGVTVHVLTQAQMKATIGQNANGAVAPNSTTKGVDVYFDGALGGKDLQRTIAHEGTHVGMDLDFIHSFDKGTGKYDSNLNFTVLQTEFISFMTGAAVKRYDYANVPCGGKPTCSFGPQEASKVKEFLHNSPTYGPVLNLQVFGTGRWPQ